MAKKTGIYIKSNRFSEIGKAFQNEVRDIITKGVFDTDAHATATVPVDTGFLKNSKQVEISEDGLSGTIAYTADYAPHVHWGTRFQSAQSFLKDAVDKVGPSVIDALEDLEGRLR